MASQFCQFDCKRKMLESVIETLQCYNCQAVPGFKEEQRNRYNCNENSHQLCEKCAISVVGRYYFCMCGSAVSRSPNPVVHQILKGLPVFCPHYKRGSREVFGKAENLEEHLMDCIFRPVYCPSLGCKELNPFKDITDHLISTHSIDSPKHSVKLSLTEVSHSFFLLTNGVSSGKLLAYWFRKFEFNETILYLVGKNVKGILYFWVYIHGSHFEAQNYAYTLSVEGKNGNKYSYYDQVKPLDWPAADIISFPFALMIGIEVAKKIRNEDQKWKIEVTIHALKEEAKDEDIESGVEDESD